MKKWFKRVLFGLLGKDPEAVVLVFGSGQPDRVSLMTREVRELIPNRRVVLITIDDDLEIPGQETILLRAGGTVALTFSLLLRCWRYRIGLAPTLFDNTRRYDSLRRAAMILAPFRILAYNARLERYHLSPLAPVSGILFLAGIPLDRITVRPRWLYPFKRDRSVIPADYRVWDGRPVSPVRRRVAILTPYLPYPLSHGGAVRMNALLREISLEFDICLFAFADSEKPLGGEQAQRVGQSVMALLPFCARVFVVAKPRYREPKWSTLLPAEVHEFSSPTMQRLWEEQSKHFRAGLRQIEYTHMAPYGGHILVEHDVTFDLYRQVYRERRRFFSWWDWWRWERFERRIVTQFQRVVVMSDKDAALLNLPYARVIPNGVELQRFRPIREKPGKSILFVGSFAHFPNLLAFRFFLEEVWPWLRQATPEATWTVIGGNDAVAHWRRYFASAAPPQDERMTLHEFVADVVPFYGNANLVVVPTLVSAGTNVKVLEAAAMQRAVLSTPSGCAGLGLEHGKSVWVAEGAARFLESALRLLSDTALRSRLAKAAREHVERQYDWRRIGLRQRALLNELLPAPLGFRRGEPEDAGALESIQRLSPGAAQWSPLDYLQHECLLACWKGQGLERDIAGFLVYRDLDDGAEILNLAVHPSARRQGVASALLSRMLSVVKGDVFLEVRVSNGPARNLYARLGFSETTLRPGYYSDPPEAAVVMRFQSC